MEHKRRNCNLILGKNSKTGPPVYHPNPRGLESRTSCRSTCDNKGNTFSSVSLIKTLSVSGPTAPLTFISPFVAQRSPSTTVNLTDTKYWFQGGTIKLAYFVESIHWDRSFETLSPLSDTSLVIKSNKLGAVFLNRNPRHCEAWLTITKVSGPH